MMPYYNPEFSMFFNVFAHALVVVGAVVVGYVVVICPFIIVYRHSNKPHRDET